MRKEIGLFRRRAPRDAGIVDKDRYRAEDSLGFTPESCTGVTIRDIKTETSGMPSVGRNPVGLRLCSVFIDVADEHTSPGRHETCRNCCTVALCGTRDDGNLARQEIFY